MPVRTIMRHRRMRRPRQVILYGLYLFSSGKATHRPIPPRKWTDSAEQRWPNDCLPGHHVAHGVPVDAEIRNAQMERQP